MLATKYCQYFIMMSQQKLKIFIIISAVMPHCVHLPPLPVPPPPYQRCKQDNVLHRHLLNCQQPLQKRTYMYVVPYYVYASLIMYR